ncbi:hypothetical protein [Psychromarinibacter halotolerans]|uniref:SIR2-like domain-containing protein n=1 Tax=Psychromarinibacter halotolerans TaxID=1775175 RepID=A0ABV7H1H7_9RHOB|nr:hypothetical protein [Psychromarinibacter halotolerans]MDF0596309.1 hypothetical protein [Psychromarinibacter halotolerans]
MNDILTRKEKPALLIGNGINIHGGDSTSSWVGLLGALSRQQGLRLTADERKEMSNTEFFDILDLAHPREDRSSLQSEFCDLMKGWRHTVHHETITGWAHRHGRPIITVNFDENLSRSKQLELFHPKKGFTDFYPWSSYFSDRRVDDPRSEFAIWHAHGMMKYSRSIRLGLTHYMGSVQRARSWVYNRKNSLREVIKNGGGEWHGSDTWLEVIFFCPIVIFGFTFGKDENFLRWLFLERAKLQKITPEPPKKIWFVVKDDEGSDSRRLFFKRLGVEFVTVPDYPDIYENEAWQS